MSSSESAKERLAVQVLPGYVPEIGRWLWALEDVRRVLKRTVATAGPAELDHRQAGSNSVGTLLYHIAAIEADWLYTEVLGTEPPAEVVALFPHPVREENGVLGHVAGESLEQHLDRLDRVRAELLAAFRGMTAEDWRTARELPQYTVTPEWVIYHLVEHEAHHRGQIADQLRILRHA